MKVECLHGYFRFTETAPGQISRFRSLFGLDIERSGDHFTFSDLVDAPTHSLPGGTFLGIPTLEAFEGPPWEVMRANGLVYNFSLGLVVPIASIVAVAPIAAAGDSYVSTGMLMPGSVTDDGSRVTDYAAFFSDRFKYSSVEVASLV